MFGNVWLVTRININNLKQCLCGDIEIRKNITSEQRLNADIWKIIVWSPWPNIEWVYDHLNRDQNPTPRSPGAPEDAKTKFVAIDVRVFSKRNPSVKVWSNCVSLKTKFQSLKYWLFHWNPKCKVGNSCRLIKTKSSKVDFVFPQNPNVKVGWFVVSSKNKIRNMRSFSTPKNHNWNYVCPHQDKNSGLGMVPSKPSFQNGADAFVH